MNLDQLFHYSITAGVIPLGFIVIAFLFLMDEDEDLGRAASGRHKSKAKAMAAFMQLCWRFKAYVAPLALGSVFFGLAGIGCRKRQLDDETSLLIAGGLGSAVALVLFCFSFLTTQQKGPAPFPARRLVGQQGKVVELIPGHRAGSGLIAIRLGELIQEMPAVTAGDDLPADCSVLVVSAVDSETVEVAASQSSRLRTEEHLPQDRRLDS